jgi:DNA mismatch repair protein MLH1
MLEEYFSLSITEDGKLESLPLIVPGYTPNLSKLPLCTSRAPRSVSRPSLTTHPTVLIRIGIQVDWTAEKPCFESFLRELAFFYIPGPAPFADDKELPKEQEAVEMRQIQHVIFPAAKQYLLPPTRLLKKDVVQVTSLESLYKV